MRYDRTVIAYHGCDAQVAARLIDGEPFRPSSNDFDWLGEGIYFWEYGYERALQFAEEQRMRGKLEHPSVVGALLQLGNCFDLMDTRFTAELNNAFEMVCAKYEEEGWSLPDNGGTPPDLLLRRRDCAVINFYLDQLVAKNEAYDSIRCGFTEGPPAYKGSGIRSKSHVQVAIRNQACILGLFKPRSTS
jgi:hypothetical protein